MSSSDGSGSGAGPRDGERAEAHVSADRAVISPAQARRGALRICRLADAMIVLVFSLFAAFVIGSNDFDWDHFLAAAEVDLRSWLLDGKPPLWSYQLCGGVTRAGDPQSFGLSPLFLPVLLLGSFWGLKLGVLLLTLLGFWAMNGLLLIFYTQGRPGRRSSPVERAIIRALSLGFVLGNYFLWHSHHGHLTFALSFLALGLVRCLLEAYFRPVPRVYWALAVLFGWGYFSAGFYGSLIFFLLPLTLGLVVALLAVLIFPSLRREGPRNGLRRLGTLLSLVVLGLILAAYKLYYVASFQLAHPRSVKPAGHIDGATLLESVLYQFAPTFDYQFFGVMSGGGAFGIWEYSAFSLNAWWCLIAVAWLLGARLRRNSTIRARPRFSWLPWVLIISVAAVGAAFAAGDQWSISAHRLLNQLLSGAVRVTGRYQVIFTLAWAWLAALLLGVHPPLRRLFFRYGVVAVPLLLSLNLLTFRATLRPRSVTEVLQLEEALIREMQLVAVVPSRTNSRSFMYPAVLQGRAVLNCYDPIWRVGVMSREFQARPELLDQEGKPRVAVYPLIDLDVANPPEACVLGSYFTQSDIHLDPSCPPGTCVNLNGISDYGETPLAFSESVRKFCLPSTPEPLTE